MKIKRFTVSFDLDYVKEELGDRILQQLESGNKDFVLGFLSNVPTKISIAEWTKEIDGYR